jgi:hypothetical protein
MIYLKVGLASQKFLMPHSTFAFSMNRIQDPQSSELVSYLQKLLNAGIGKENANVRGSSNNNLDSNPDTTHKNGNVRPGSSEIPRLAKIIFEV